MRRCSPESPDVGRLLQLLAKVVYDDADPAFSRRCGAANRLAAAVAAPGGPSGSDLRTLAEAAFFGRRQFGLVSLERAFDAPSSPASYKFGVAKCLATVGVALGAEAELFVTWIFKRLAAVPDEPNRADVERERKVWLLAALREAVRYPLDGKEADALAPSVRGMLAGITSFLEKMEAFDYLGSIITILEAISTRFPDAFGQAFPDVVDLLVSWHIDPRLSDHLQNAMSDAYLAFEPFWKPHLSLAVEIMVHLIKDIEQSAAISSYRQGSSRLAAELEQPNGEGRSERAKPLSKDDAGVCTCALGTFCAVTRAVGPSLEGECGDDIELRIDTIRKRALRAVALVTERIGTSKKWLALGFKAVETLAAFRKRTWYDAQLDAALVFSVFSRTSVRSASGAERWIRELTCAVGRWGPRYSPELAAYLADPNGCLMRMRTAFGNCPRIFSSCLRLLSALFDSCAAALSSEQVCGIIRRLLAEANLMVAQVAARARRPSHSAAAESPHWSTAMSLCCSEPIYFGMPPQCPEAGDPNGRRTSSTPSIAKPVAEALLTFDVMLVEKVLLSSGGNADTAGHVVIALLALLLRFPQGRSGSACPRAQMSIINAVRRLQSLQQPHDVGDAAEPRAPVAPTASGLPARSTQTPPIPTISVPLAVSLHMIAEYLLNRSVAAEIREASFEWLQDIVHRASREQSGRAVPTGAVRMIELLMAEALTAISSERGKFRARLLDLAALCSRKLNVFVRGSALAAVLQRLADSEEAVRESCFRFLISLNPVTTILEGIPAEDFNAREFQTAVIMTGYSGTFHSAHFQSAVSSFGMGRYLAEGCEFAEAAAPNAARADVAAPPPSFQGAAAPLVLRRRNEVEKCSDEWKLRMFYACRATMAVSEARRGWWSRPDPGERRRPPAAAGGADDEPPQTSEPRRTFPPVDCSDNLLTFWITWEAAKYCILARLRTPFGGPPNTLEALEQRLNSLISSPHPGPDPKRRVPELRTFARLLDRLDVQLLNAEVGTSLRVIPAVPKAVGQFFRANRRVCDEWVSRTRARLVAVAAEAGDLGVVVRQGLEYVREKLRAVVGDECQSGGKSRQEMYRVLVDVACALEKLGAEDALAGLQTLLRKSSGANCPTVVSQAGKDRQFEYAWIEPARFAAGGRIESAARCGRRLWAERVSGGAAGHAVECTAFLAKTVCDSYRALHDWPSLESFRREVEAVAEAFPNAKGDILAAVGNDSAHLQALSLFDDAAFDGETGAGGAQFHWADYPGASWKTPALESAELQASRGAAAALSGSSGRAAADFAAALRTLRNGAANKVYVGQHAGLLPLLVNAQLVAAAGDPASGRRLSELLAGGRERRRLRMRTCCDDVCVWAAAHRAAEHYQAKDGDSPDSAGVLTAVRCILIRTLRKAGCNDSAKLLVDSARWPGGRLPWTAAYEGAKLTASAEGATSRTANALVGLALSAPSATDQLITAMPAAELRASVCLKISKLLASVPADRAEAALVEPMAKLAGLRPVLPPEEAGPPLLFRVDLRSAPPPQPSAGADDLRLFAEHALHCAVRQAPAFHKAWSRFGSYFFRKGFKLVEDAAKAKTSRLCVKKVLTVIDTSLRGLSAVDAPHTRQRMAKDIVADFAQYVSSNDPAEQLNWSDLLQQRMSLTPLAESACSRRQIISALKQIQREIVEAFEAAARGFFNFLHVVQPTEPRGTDIWQKEPDAGRRAPDAATELRPPRRRTDPDEPYTVPSALRLIRLLFKYGVMLKSTLEEGFRAVHVRPFEAIIPQLSARLSHPEPFVRTQVSRLLTRIASTAPLSIIHYALVGPESAMATEETRAVFAVILAPIAAGNPELVSETRRTIAEFNRMTVLWEEMWLNMIMRLQPVAASLLREVGDLLGSSKDAPGAAGAYSSVMHPLVSALRPLLDATSGPCASDHERWFQKEFGPRLASAFDRLQHPPAAAYDDGWERFMEILRDLTRIVHRPRTLRMEDLSPFLSEMKISNFIIPAAQADPPVTLHAFRSRVEVLPTKTKPKKITMVGSDGKDHLYFLKGHEDLRLDERVMQFHDVTNQLLKRKHCAAERGLRMENYAVFPLSDKSGMIECVENTTSIFSVYRRWQDREFAARTEAAAAAAAEKNPPGGPVEEVLRPNDMFNRKLAAALQREKLEVKSRSQVPGRVLADVFRELSRETPGDLLKNELLCCAPTALEFWRRTTTFARSVAVSSMVGYVLGLGDRHLDNILVDFEKGTVLNIDYNVCFDKGKALRIPETVPFRMTQNLENAMGVSGVDGDFTASSEHAMAVLRDNREILCAVLEAFVYDPLVDWTDRRNPEAVGDADDDDDNAADEVGPSAGAESGAADADGGEQSAMLSQPTEGENENAVAQNAPGAVAPGRPERLAKAPGKNAQAMAVLRRVHATLEGRAEDSQRRMSISQQVEGAIREATSLTNLAYMYEGWAAWV